VLHKAVRTAVSEGSQMGLLLKQLFGFVKLLNSETGSIQIATGIAAGFVLGMTPFFSLQSLLIFVCLFLFRIQIGAAFLAAFFFAFIAYLLDPVFHLVGKAVLTSPGLAPTFTTLYNMPIVPMTRFNNTIVMGSGIVAILMTPFIYILARKLVQKYRETVVARFKQTKYWKAIQATSFYKWYYTYDSLYGR
jgi:uncharacterized protein (TIGR03546 family)